VSQIRPARIDDLDDVARLYEQVMRSGSGVAPPGLAENLRRTVLEHPWVDPEIPSLVYEDAQGRITGFLGTHPRRIILNGRPGRIAYAGQLVADPRAQNKAIGALLLRQLFAGVQDATLTDGATRRVQQIWEVLGGRSLTSSITWLRVLRPVSLAANYVLRGASMPRIEHALRTASRSIDGAARFVRYPSVGSQRELEATELTPLALVDNLGTFSHEIGGYVAYDEHFATWLFREMADLKSRGELIRILLRERGGRAVGSYVYYLRPGGISDVVHLAATKGARDDVFAHLFGHADEGGAAAVRGRVEPALVGAFATRRYIFRLGEIMLVHSRDREFLAAIGSGDCQLTRLDGEWWMGPHLEPFV
jgi:GNAT superfamily N-acetyltransferase